MNNNTDEILNEAAEIQSAEVISDDASLNDMHDENAVIEICGLEKKYGSKKAVSNASFTVKRGEIMGFLGPNGAGKSTTMNILTGYLSPTSGTVKVDGFDILEYPTEAKKRIGYLPENPPLYFDMTVLEYLDFVYDLKKVKLNKEEHIAEVMRMVKITAVKDRMIKNLSKGYKQRVGLAQALIGDPEVLVLDEPTVGLDPKQIIEIRNVIKELGKKRTVILSTHILQEVSAVCDRVTVINRGHIIVSDTLSNVQQNMGDKGKYILRIAATEQQAKNALAEVRNTKFIGYIGEKEPGTVDFVVEALDGFDIRRDIFSAFTAANLPLIGFKSSELTLEEIFIRLTNSAEYIPEDEEEEEKQGFFKKLFSKKKSDAKAEEEDKHGEDTSEKKEEDSEETEAVSENNGESEAGE